MSFGAKEQTSQSQGTTQSQSNQGSYYDPTQTGLVNSYAAGIANKVQPGSLAYTPYSGAPLSFGDPTALNGLTTYAAPQATASTYDASKVDPAAVNADTASFMNPFTQGVIDTTNADLARQGAIQRTANAGTATANGAFGGSRSAVLQNLDDASMQRAMASTEASLRQQGYTQAQQAALGVAQGNQTAQNAAASQNAAAQTATSQANQQANLQGAQTKLQAIGMSADQAQALFGANWAQFVNSQQDPQALLALANNAMSLVPTGPLSFGQSSSYGQNSSSGQGAGFDLGIPMPAPTGD